MQLTVSILMSVYGKEKAEFLDNALLSIWDEQTIKPQQIVLIEDGPLNDALYSVISRWEEKLGSILTIVRNERNLGLVASLNKGIKLINSDLIARMDSDDRSTPQRLELQRRYFEEHPNVDIISGSLQEFDETSDCLYIRNYPLTHEECIKTIAKASPLAHPAVMMRSSLFKEDGLRYNELCTLNEDIALWFDAINTGHRVGNVKDVILYFRRSGDIYQRRGKQKAWGEFKIYMKGIFKLKGLFTTYYIYPILRLIFRCMPISLIHKIYNSSLRKRITE